MKSQTILLENEIVCVGGLVKGCDFFKNFFFTLIKLYILVYFYWIGIIQFIGNIEGNVVKNSIIIYIDGDKSNTFK